VLWSLFGGDFETRFIIEIFHNNRSHNLNTGQEGKEKVNMNIRPLHDRIIVERLEEETMTAAGIIIPDSAKEKPQQGKVIAVGKGKVSEEGKVRPLDVKAGDKVLFGKYAGTEVKLDGKEYLMMREDDILGVVE
jgi:chaperonin GroES